MKINNRQDDQSPANYAMKIMFLAKVIMSSTACRPTPSLSFRRKTCFSRGVNFGTLRNTRGANKNHAGNPSNSPSFHIALVLPSVSWARSSDKIKGFSLRQGFIFLRDLEYIGPMG